MQFYVGKINLVTKEMIGKLLAPQAVSKKKWDTKESS